jgi:anti-sigma factor RsiW
VNCEQARELAALAASGDVTPAEERALACHMAGCGECRAEAQEFEVLCGHLAAMREESAPEHVYAAVRARVLGEIGERHRSGWLAAWPAFAVVVACTVILAVVLHPEARVTNHQVHQPEAVVAETAAPEEATAIAASPALRRVRRAVKLAKSQEPVEPLVVHMFTDDPDVVIYWIADGRGSVQ